MTLATTGTGSHADEADALIILGSTGQKGPFKGELTMVPEADVTKVVNAAIDRWVVLYGVPTAVEIFGLAGRWKPYDLLTIGLTQRVAMRRLRQWLAHAPDHDAAVTRAEQLLATKALAHWSTTGRYQLGTEALAYLFPDHQPFFDATIAQLDAADWKTSYLLGSVRTAEDYARIAPRLGGADLDTHAVVIARSLREDGLPVLLGHAPYGKTGVALALTAYHSLEAAAGLASLLPQKTTHKILTEYFKRHPELAEAAFAPHVASTKKPIRDAAAKILAAAR